MTHECPGRGCTRQVPPNRLACPGCWFQLPAELRNAVNGTYYARTKVTSDKHSAAVRAHRVALTDALAWYRAHSVRIP